MRCVGACHQGIAHKATHHTECVCTALQVTISGRPKNTGVFFMSVPRFEKIWPDMLRLGVDFAFDFKEKAYDQGWLNFFFINVRRHRNVSLLPPEWNWKVYWNSRNKSPYIVHFHGPKPGLGDYFECLASRDPTCVPSIMWSNYSGPGKRGSLDRLVKLGFDSDGGRMANRTLRQYRNLLPPASEFC